MGQEEFILKMKSLEKKELTEEEVLREADSNIIVAAIIDILFGIAAYCNLLSLIKTLRLGELFYTGGLTSHRYISQTRGSKLISQEVIEKATFDIMVVPLGILIIGGAVVYYHCSLAKKANFSTLGEILVGTKVNKCKEKKWENPHFINRSGLYLICILSFLLSTIYFEGTLGANNIYSIVHIGIKYLIFLLSLFGLVALGKGNLNGGCLFILSYIIGYFQSSNLSEIIMFNSGIDHSPEANLSKIYLGMIFIAIVALAISYKNKEKVMKRLNL